MIATITSAGLEAPISYAREIAFFLISWLGGVAIGIAIDKTFIRRRNRRSIGRTSVITKA